MPLIVALHVIICRNIYPLIISPYWLPHPFNGNGTELRAKAPSPRRVRNITEWLEDGLDRSSNTQVTKSVLLFIAAAITVGHCLANPIDEPEISNS